MGLMNFFIENDKSIIKNYRKIFVNKTGFGELANLIIEEITQKITEQFNKINLNINGYYNGKKNIKESIHMFKVPSGGGKTSLEKNIFSARIENTNKYRTKPEDNLERMIKLSGQKLDNNIIYENQVAIPDTNQASHIDLLKKYDNTIEIVELKKWENTSNPPTWAIVECIKNLYMFLNFCIHLKSNTSYKGIEYVKKFKNKQLKNNGLGIYDIDNIKTFKLIVLAPKEYYDETHFAGINNKPKLKVVFKKFCELLEKSIERDINQKLNKNYHIKIEIKYFTLLKGGKPKAKEVYENIKNNIIMDFIAKERAQKPNWRPNNKDNTGDIDLSSYININSTKSDKLFPVEICKALITWKDYPLDNTQERQF